MDPRACDNEVNEGENKNLNKINPPLSPPGRGIKGVGSASADLHGGIFLAQEGFLCLQTEA